MAFNEDKQKKSAPVKAGAVEKKEFTLRIPIALQQRIQAVADIRGMSMKQLVEEVLTDFVIEEVRKIVDRSSKYNG